MTSMQLLGAALLIFTFTGDKMMTKSRINGLRSTLERTFRSGGASIEIRASGELPKMMNFPNCRCYAVLGERRNGVATYCFKEYERNGGYRRLF